MVIRRLSRAIKRFSALPARIARIQESLGRIEQRQISHLGVGIESSEFRVFSQWGEDGIIQYLVRSVPIERPIFVEFGVENYLESNTRFLLTNNQWSGLIMDGSAQNIADIKRDAIYWASNLKAEHAFITAENIDGLLRSNGIEGDIGLLSVDIDGNDYWVWRDIRSIAPRIVVCEYNSHFGPTARVTTPYDPGFVRDRAHYSKIYYGASIGALVQLAGQKGYTLVAGNSAGNNVFFVRNDVLGALQPRRQEDVYRRSTFRECHDRDGALTFEDFESRLRRIADLPVHDIDSNSNRRIADVPGIGAGVAR